MPKNRYMLCSCCGRGFMGQQDRDHDKGYSDCPECAAQAEIRNEADWDRLKFMVAQALNPTNRAQFLAMEKGLQRGLMLKMMEDGIIKWRIKRSESKSIFDL